MNFVMRAKGITDVGVVREANQDAYLLANPLFAVADGMGGAQGGEVASATALEVLKATFNDDRGGDDLVEAVRRANAKVWDKAQLNDHLRGMGTTLTAIAKVDDEDGQRLAVINVGDSRAYLMRNGELTQVTTDHSLVEEMVRAGEITAEEAEIHPRRNILTRALGVEPTVNSDIEYLTPELHDRLLLCSDGLVREVGDNQIAAVLRRLRNADEACRELVAMAKTAGGHDNITIVIIDIESEDQPEATPAGEEPTKANKAKKTKASARRQSGVVTFRLVLFFLAMGALLGLAVGSVFWYARASYFVRADGNELVIYQGRAEPVLWFEPTVKQRTGVTLDDVLPSQRPRLVSGQPQASLLDARRYVDNLLSEATAARRFTPPTTVPADPPTAAASP